MQIKIFTIPVLGGELLTDEMNVFLRSKKVLQIENQLVSQTQGAFWCFCVKYLGDIAATEREKQRVDYREVLDEATFKRFADLREIRKRVATEEAVPAYVIFSDAELAAFAKTAPLTAASMKAVNGIGEKKIEKYGHYFLTKPTDEKG
ncbi:MAG TPA: HRDC domain-containing protein [Saprospiraceae bacterium]|nr:HRDC domain-containing protein [Saprospiraceae bacterium]